MIGVDDLHLNIVSSATSVDAEFAAIRKCKTNYRKMIVEMTRIINPIEHKMCAKDDLSVVTDVCTKFCFR